MSFREKMMGVTIGIPFLVQQEHIPGFSSESLNL